MTYIHPPEIVESFRSDDFRFTNGNLRFSSPLLEATLYQGNHDRKHKLWRIVSTERYIYSICRCCWNVATYKWKVKLKSSLLTASFVLEVFLKYRSIKNKLAATTRQKWFRSFFCTEPLRTVIKWSLNGTLK